MGIERASGVAVGASVLVHWVAFALLVVPACTEARGSFPQAQHQADAGLPTDAAREREREDGGVKPTRAMRATRANEDAADPDGTDPASNGPAREQDASDSAGSGGKAGSAGAGGQDNGPPEPAAGSGGSSGSMPGVQADRWTSVADPTCSVDGCIRSVRLVGDYGIDELLPYLEPDVRIDNGYTVATLEYVTRKRTSLANVTIPYPLAAPAGGYPVVVNAHGATGLEDPCRTADTTYGTGLSGLFGARGAIGIAPDNPGLGTAGVLPYLVSEVEGAAELDAIRAALALAKALDIPTSGRAAVVGLAAGGHAVLAAAALHGSYAPELDVRAFGASGPASVWLETWQRGISVDGSHIPYHAMLLYAWAGYYGYTGRSVWAPSIAGQIDTIMADDCAFDLGNTRETYEQRLGTAASAIFAADFLAAYRTGTLDAFAPTLAEAFATNRIGPYAQTAPLKIWQGANDTSVIPSDTQALVDALNRGGNQVEYQLVQGATDQVAFGYLSQHQAATEDSIAWIFEQLRR